MGYGLGAGIVAFSLIMRAIYTPFTIYSQICALKTQMLQPEMNAHRQTIMKIYKTGNKLHLAQANEEFHKLKRKYGIRSGFQAVPLTQLPFIVFFFWTIQDMVYTAELFPGMETDGFLWFKDLTEPDPYFLLPLGLAFSSFVSMHKSPMTSQITGPLAKYGKYMKFLPFLAIPVSSTFPSAIVLNWFMMSSFQVFCNSFVYTQAGRKLLNIPEYLPGSMMEKLHSKQTVEVQKPKVYTHKVPKQSKNNT